MSKYFRFIAILFVMCTESLFANLHPCPGGWGVDVEFLYLFPTIGDTYFVIESPALGLDDPIGTRKNNDFGFHPGFRVGGFYGFCECNRELQIYYTRLRATESRTVSGILSASIGSAQLADDIEEYLGTASSDLDLLYHRLDGLIVQQAWCWCGVDTYFHGGVEFAYIRLNENYAFVPFDIEEDTGDIFQQSKMWGVGPQAGLEFDYRICDFSCYCPGTLSINFLSTGSILASKTRGEVLNIQEGETILDVTNEHTWRFIPAFHTRIGLNYVFCFSCINAALEIGYEFSTYLNAITRTIYPDDVATRLSFSNYDNYDVQGLYVSLAVAF